MSHQEQFETDRENEAVGDGICEKCGKLMCECEGNGERLLTESPSPITDALGRDALDVLLEDASRKMEQLRRTRDSRAIAASSANTRMLMDAIFGAGGKL